VSLTECCGRPCDTPFCPLCGERREAVQCLRALLAHCRARQKAAHVRARRCADWVRGQPQYDFKDEKRLDDRRAVADRWGAWADALEVVLEAAPPAPED
jgi:hypothetical protein